MARVIAKEFAKLLHHEVEKDGTVGAANLSACSAAIAVLNGGRGGANIPDDDRKGCWNHVARHLRDGDREPPELKSADPDRSEEILRRLDVELAFGTRP